MRYQMTRWDPFRDLMTIQNELGRLFGQTFGGSETVTQGAWVPFLDLYETADAYVCNIDLPGMAPEDIEVTLDQNLLTIRGERKFRDEQVKDESFHRLERRYGSFARTISLPSQVDADGIQAEFADGVLKVAVPKAEQAKPRRIKVGEGARQLNA